MTAVVGFFFTPIGGSGASGRAEREQHIRNLKRTRGSGALPLRPPYAFHTVARLSVVWGPAIDYIRISTCTKQWGHGLKILVGRFSTAVPLRGQTTWILTGLSPERDCSTKTVKKGQTAWHGHFPIILLILL